MDDRLVGDKLSYGDRFSDTGEFGSRPCQNILGDAVILKGEDEGEDSCLLKLFYRWSVDASLPTFDSPTRGKLGEFLRRAMGLSSDSGRFCMNDMLLVGDEFVLFVPFCTRSGGTCAHVKLDTCFDQNSNSPTAQPF